MAASPLDQPPGAAAPGAAGPGEPGEPADSVGQDAACEEPWWEPPEREPSDAELCGAWPDPFAGPPDGPRAWPDPVAGPPDGPRAWPASLSDAWLAEADAPSGFAEDGPWDALIPDPVLAGLVEDAAGAGLAMLPDDALVGVLRAARRLASWQAGLELAVIGELDARRQREAARPGWSRVSEHISAELAAALVLTGRSADALLGLSRALARLPAVLTALREGRIDRARAEVFAAELGQLDDLSAAAVALGFAGLAESMTTGQLRAALRSMVLAIDPDAVRRRAEASRTQARVESWHEGSGNIGLAGRELPPAEAIAADARLTAIAKALRAAGAPGGLDQLRAAAYTALLTGRDPEALLPGSSRSASDVPRPAAGHPAAATAGHPAAATAGAGGLSGPASRDGGGSAGGPGAGGPSAGGPGVAGPGVAGPGAGDGEQVRPDPAPVPQPGSLAALSGSVHLTMPLSAWLALSDRPGEVAGHGPVDVYTCRDLADRLAAGSGTRWCITLTNRDGQAVAHACARHGPPDPGPGAGCGVYSGAGPPGLPKLARLRQWLASPTFTWLEQDPCGHARQATGYRPPPSLAHLVRIRQRTCSFPGCRRPARRCDLDHTVPYEQGGLTCECNMAPLCRAHHRAKQAPGWQLIQPAPGVLVWTPPHGRSYPVSPQSYAL